MNRVILVVLLAFPALNAAAVEVEKTFNKTCGICHISGVAMAPKVGNAKDWKPRLANGVDALVQSVVKGKGAMPPKGMCKNCSTADFEALVEYMLPKQ